MPRPRKTLEQLALSGTLTHNKNRYRHLLNEEQPQANLQSVQPVRFRSPKHFNTDERAAHKEIMGTLPGVTEADRLLVELCSQLLAKQRAGNAKTSEINKLVGTLEKLRSRSASVAVSTPASSNDDEEEDEWDEFIREDEEDAADALLDKQDIQAEIERRRNSPMRSLTEREQKYYFNHHEVGLAIGVIVNLQDKENRHAGTSRRRYQERIKERGGWAE
jgi:hypothetical protein